MTKIKEAAERLQRRTNGKEFDFYEICQAVIDNSDSVDEFRYLLFNQDAWFDIYGSGVIQETWYLEEQFFETKEYRHSILPFMEAIIWEVALTRNFKSDWIKALEL